MVWTYESPSTSDKDAVRFLVGDVDTDDQLVQDGEIEFVLETARSLYDAAADICEVLANRFAREVSHSGDGLSWSGNQLSQQYAERAAALRAMDSRVRSRGVAPYAGGFSWSERQKADSDSDKIPTSFRSHQHDHPDTLGTNPDDPRRSPKW